MSDLDPRTQERKLPTGVTEFDQFVEELRTHYELPTEDSDSIKFTLASIIMHLGPQDSHKSLEFFYKSLVAGASKQIAHHVFQTIKLAQQQRMADEAAAAAAKEVPNEAKES